MNMASTLRSRLGPLVLACVLACPVAAPIAMPLGAGLVAHADPEPVPAEWSCATAAAPEPVRFRFWIGAFEFSLALGGEAGFTLAFEGLR